MGDKIPKGARVVGQQRAMLVTLIVERYVRGESIRAIADDIGRSYGFVHGVLRQTEIPLRARGGATSRAGMATRGAARR